ncbi:MAG TPA: ABC transporter substrate-binding protein [Candidatus Binatia bacterium]|jgi:ABC-type nitrate/sulfonate/bicarbonate transport system substrate-binding protein
MSTAIRAGAGFDDWNHLLNLLIAEAEGYFRAEALSVTPVVTGGDEKTVEALGNGTVDVAVDATAKLLVKARSGGKDIYVVGARRKNSGFTLFGPPGAKTIDDLRGKKISATHPGGESDTQIRVLLRRAGLDAERDVTIQYEMDTKHENWALVEALMSGQVDAIILAPVHAMEEKLRAGGYPVLADLRTAEPPRQDRLLAANGKFAREKAAALTAFLKAVIRTNLFLKEPANRGKVLKIINDAGYNEPQDHFDSLYEPLVGYRLQPDAAIDLAGFDMVVEEEKSFGRIPASFQSADALYLKPLEAAHRELGL